MAMENDNSESSLKPSVESLVLQVNEFYYDPESNRVLLKSQVGRTAQEILAHTRGHKTSSHQYISIDAGGQLHPGERKLRL
ncbi:hypothetical protein ACTXT7_011533 [Hymenolepis weldensis]